MKKLVAWVKKYSGFIVGFAGIVVLVFMVLQTMRANKYYDKYLVSEGNFQAKNDAYVELKKQTDKDKVALAKERDKEKKAREKTDKEISRIRAEGRKKDKALAEAKAKISELTPDELTSELNSRVPTEFTLLAAGDFTLTRYGGERTLSLFMDGERCLETLSEQDSEIEKRKNKEKGFNTTILNLQTDLTKTENALKSCDGARLAAITSKDNLEKAFSGMKFVQFVKGAGTVVLIYGGLKLFGVI
jgi:vacuolar-type H+-ATPase subunit I/STV1